jgi:hypothetical protein
MLADSDTSKEQEEHATSVLVGSKPHGSRTPSVTSTIQTFSKCQVQSSISISELCLSQMEHSAMLYRSCKERIPVINASSQKLTVQLLASSKAIPKLPKPQALNTRGLALCHLGIAATSASLAASGLGVMNFTRTFAASPKLLLAIRDPALPE